LYYWVIINTRVISFKNTTQTTLEAI